MQLGGRPVGEVAGGFDLGELLEAVRAAATPEELVSASEAISVVPQTLRSNRRAARGTAVRGSRIQGRRAGTKLGAAVVVTVFTASASLAITGQLPPGARDVAAGYVGADGTVPGPEARGIDTACRSIHDRGAVGTGGRGGTFRPMWLWVSQPQGDEGIDPPRVDPTPVDPQPVIDPTPVDPPPVVDPPPGDNPPHVIDPTPVDPPPVIDPPRGDEPPPVIDPPPGDEPPPVIDPPPAVDPAPSRTRRPWSTRPSRTRRPWSTRPSRTRRPWSTRRPAMDRPSTRRRATRRPSTRRRATRRPSTRRLWIRRPSCDRRCRGASSGQMAPRGARPLRDACDGLQNSSVDDPGCQEANGEAVCGPLGRDLGAAQTGRLTRRSMKPSGPR